MISFPLVVVDGNLPLPSLLALIIALCHTHIVHGEQEKLGGLSLDTAELVLPGLVAGLISDLEQVSGLVILIVSSSLCPTCSRT